MKNATATGSITTATRFLNSIHCSAKSRVERSALRIVPSPELKVLISESSSNLPPRIVSTKSGPARLPKASIASAVAADSDFSVLICLNISMIAAGVSLALRFRSFIVAARSADGLAKLPTESRRPERTVVMLTPVFSNAPNIAAAWLRSKPRLRSGAPNWTMLRARSETVAPVF